MEIKSKKIEMVSVGSLLHHPKNMNKHSDDQIERLVKLIEYQGFRNPLVVQKGTNLVVAGNGRLMAAKKMGLKQVPVIYQEFDSEAQLYAYMTSDNAIASWSELDLSMVNKEMLDLGPDFDLDLLAIKDFVIEPVEKYELQGDPDEVPEPPKEPKTVRGDIYEIGTHRVMCGDSIMTDDIEKLMDGEKFQLMITDLPYGVSYADKNESLNAFDKGNRNQREIQNDHITPEKLLDFAKSIYTNMFIFCDKVSSYYAFMPQGGEQMMMMMMALKESGFQVKHELIWLKNNHVLGRTDYAYKHEPICYGWASNGTHKYYGSFHTSIFEFPKPTSSKLHPTMKPIELLEALINNSSKKLDVVIDPTLGSGSTLIACEKTNRKCYGMELDPIYCDVIITRWCKLTGQTKIKRNGEEIEWVI